MDAADDICVIDRQSANLNTLIKPDQMRGGKEAGLDSGRPAYGVNHCADRSLAVRTGDMDKPQFVLRFSQGCQQMPNVV